MTTNQGYVQTRCPRCGAGAWALPTQPVPCQSCGQPVGPIGAAAMAPPAAPIPPAQMPYGTGAGAAPYGGQAAPYGGQAAPYGGQAAPYGGQAAPYGGQAANPYAGQQQFAGAYPGSAPAPMPAAAPAAAAPAAAPASPAAQFSVNVGGIKIPFKLGGGGGMSKFKIIGSVVLVIALSIAGVFIKMKMGGTAKGNLSYASLGVDKKKPDGDKLIAALATPAKKWKKDAIWWSANFQAVDAEGRVDVSKGAEVVYISENGVQSNAKSIRKDSIKKYGAGVAGVKHSDLWGATDPWEGVEKHPEPQCKLKDVMAIVGKQLPAGKTVRVTFDPKFADYYAWRVLSDNPKIDTLYAFSDCSEIK